jgi:hypothetical protein
VKARWLLVAVALFFRLPLLLQSHLTSDAAVVGLQGMHLLRGEFSRLLWKAPYQSSAETAVAALFELVLGARPLALAAGPVLEQLLLCWLVHRLLSPHLQEWPAAVACLPLAIPVFPLIAPVIFGTRSLVGLVAMLGVLLSETGRPALAAAVIVFCVYLDLYALEMLPGLLLIVVLGLKSARRAVMAGASAAAAGALVFLLLANDSTGILVSGPHYALSGKFSLLARVCLPTALGSYWHRLDGTEIRAGWAPLRALGGATLLAGIASGAALAGRQSLPAAVRRFGLCGAVMAGTSVAAFLVSSMPEDFWSSRYFVALLWAAPLALAPAAYLLGAGRLLAGLSPWLVSASIAAALALGMPASLRPAPLDGLSPDERALRDFLRSRGVRAGAAEYWTSYRLTYLFAENPILVPFSPDQQRYPPYRALPLTAWVSRGSPPSPHPDAEEAHFGAYTVLLLKPR